MRLKLFPLTRETTHVQRTCCECGRPLRPGAQCVVQRRSKEAWAHEACGKKWAAETATKLEEFQDSISV